MKIVKTDILSEPKGQFIIEFESENAMRDVEQMLPFGKTSPQDPNVTW